MEVEIPKVNEQFAIIADRSKQDLAAIISTYISHPSEYVPTFEFPFVTANDHEYVEDEIDENHLSITRANEFATFVNNVFARIGKIENVVLAGLSEQQKSYLDFLKYSNVIIIDDIKEIDFSLSPFLNEEKEKLQCKPTELLLGVSIALQTNKVLVVADMADVLTNALQPGKGLIVIENDYSVGTVIALNYAVAINANILIVEKLDRQDKNLMQTYLQEWKDGNEDQYNVIAELVKSRVGYIDFTQFPFATFFTIGLPYSLVLKNCIPISYVNISLRPDFFIINNLLYQKYIQYSGAVVFSPEFFIDEETKEVSRILSEANYFTKELFGQKATVYNLDMHIKEFPFDIFHLCTHGGEILGTPILEEFTDSKGNKHSVEYDSVLTLSPSNKRGYFLVQHKTYYRKFDGFIWGSKNLKEQPYDHNVFSDMVNAMRKSNATQKKVLGPKKRVPNSCEIVCSDGSHQGMFNAVASHSYPFVFNNACWTWLHIAENFLVGGCRGYIGTLWKVNNKVAVTFARDFYTNGFQDTILNSFHKAMETTVGSTSENIYIFWGLHFARFTPPISKEESRLDTFGEIFNSMHLWKTRLSITKKKKTSELIAELMKWDLNELTTTFKISDYENFKARVLKKRQEKKRN